MRVIPFLLTTVFLTAATATQAEKIYRWTDENGQTHFGSQPPRELREPAESVTIKIPRSSDTGNAVAEKKPEAVQAPQKTTDTTEIDTEEAASRCKQAREHKQVLAENYNRRFNMPDGEARPLTDEERAGQNKLADELIQKYCR